ncbi:NAD(P)-binding protein [Aspergillus californicus]
MSASILITGGTAGLGYHCAVALARQYPNHRVIVASRSDPSIKYPLGQANIQYMRLDLSSLSQIRLFTQKWAEGKNPPITHLLFNAGLQLPHEVSYTVDGYEKTFAVNHIGHALLFSLLIPHLAQTARIVITASGTHDPAQKTGMPDATYTTAEGLAHPTVQSKNNPGRQRYTTSKLANIIWAYALDRRFAELRNKDGNQGRKWTVVAFDPGLVPGTGLARDAGAAMRFMWTRVLPRALPLLRALVSPNIHSAEESGRALAYLASDSEKLGASGVYFEGKKEIKSSEESYDQTKQEDLWEWTVKNVAANPEEVVQFSLKNLL